MLTPGTDNSTPVAFWRTVKLLLVAAHRRFMNRMSHQRELARRRRAAVKKIAKEITPDRPESSSFGKAANALEYLGFAFIVGLMIVLHVLSAMFVLNVVGASQRWELEQEGKILVHENTLAMLHQLESENADFSAEAVQ